MPILRIYVTILRQAVEKAIKALLLRYDVEFPYVHNIAQLLTLLEEAGQEIPEFVMEFRETH